MARARTVAPGMSFVYRIVNGPDAFGSDVKLWPERFEHLLDLTNVRTLELHAVYRDAAGNTTTEGVQLEYAVYENIATPFADSGEMWVLKDIGTIDGDEQERVDARTMGPRCVITITTLSLGLATDCALMVSGAQPY